MNKEEIGKAISKIYECIDELDAEFDGMPANIDGKEDVVNAVDELCAVIGITPPKWAKELHEKYWFNGTYIG